MRLIGNQNSVGMDNIRMASAGNIDYVMIMENIWYCYG